MAVLDDGRLIAEGAHADLLEREPRYAAILSYELADDSDELCPTDAPGGR